MNIRPITLKLIASLLAVLSLPVDAQQSEWEKTAPGVWKLTVGKPAGYDLITAAGTVASSQLLKMSDAPFPIEKGSISTTTVNGKIYLKLPLEKGENIFGLGLNFKEVNQRGNILTLHVDHYGGSDNGRTHAPVPFYVSDKGYGVFINSPTYITVYAGTAVNKERLKQEDIKDRNTDKDWSSRPYSDAMEILVPASGCEVYIFSGPTSLEAVRRFNLFSGGGALPPRWGLGFTQRVPTLYTASDVEKEANEFAEKGFPLDFIGLEPGWQSKSYPCTFEWDKGRFPDPAGFAGKMLERGIRINLWTNPYVSPESPVYKSLLPLAGSHTVWGGIVPDHSLKEANDIFTGQLMKSQVSIGVAGYKLDENDGYDTWLWPDVATFPSGRSAEEMRQTYGLHLQRITFELFRKTDRRTWGLTRASNAGGTRFPYVIYNDYYSHRDFITALINSGFIGVLWTPEVRSSKTAEEWLRRFQTVVFSPMAMINAWADGTKPWSFPEVESDIKYYSMLRMQLLPYFYSEFAKYHFYGTPPFRGMALETGSGEPSDIVLRNENISEYPYGEAVTKEIRDQYMAGEYLLVAPMFMGETTRMVELPKGNWYDFYTGDYAGNGEVIKATPGLSRIPVFVKDGALIPFGPARLHAPASGEKTDMEIRHYGIKPGRYMIYDDDGETFAYEKGEYQWRTVTTEKDKSGKWIGTVTKTEKGKPDNIGKVTFKFMTKE
jgi:alpha-D-xyloside xylohydrolase